MKDENKSPRKIRYPEQIRFRGERARRVVSGLISDKISVRQRLNYRCPLVHASASSRLVKTRVSLCDSLACSSAVLPRRD